jgi:hypothetical protein
MKKRSMSDKINRGFCLIVIVLGSTMMILGAIRAVNYHKCECEYDSDHFYIYPDTVSNDTTWKN